MKEGLSPHSKSIGAGQGHTVWRSYDGRPDAL